MLIDAHAHIDQYDDDDLESVLIEIDQNRILTISTSMDLLSYERNLEIARMSDFVLPTFGVHPWNAPRYVETLDRLRDSTERSPMLGEIGLDFHWVEDASQFSAQRKVFEFFLAAAKEQEKIVNLHTKGAEREVLQRLDDYGVQRAIVHWYSGPLDVLREFISRQTYFTVGIEVLHSGHIQDIARELPSELLLTETDNPGGPKWFSGKPGNPLMLEDVVHALAELRKTPVDAVARTVRDNFLRLIKDDPWLSDFYNKIRRDRDLTE